MNRDIVFLINKSEITAGTRGSSLGPESIITAARTKGKTIFGDYPIQLIKDQNSLLDQKTTHQFAKRIDGLQSVYEDLNQKVSTLLLGNKFPLILAGDHGSAGGTIAGIKTAFPDKKLGVVWIDAHADIHTPFTTPSGNMHGMPLATALNEDNKECQSNVVSEETILCWENLKNCGGLKGKVKPEHLVYIAVRDTEEQENKIIQRLNIKNYSVETLREKGITNVINEIEEKLSDCELIYVSFDVDSMDPDLTSYGTGTPVKNGISPEEASKLLVAFANNKKTICIEFVEVNPCLDEKANTMAEITLGLIETVLNEYK